MTTQLPQHFLDPSSTTTQGTVVVPDPKPKAITDFGRFPSTDLLQVGDLLLFSALKPRYPARLITRTQMGGGFSAEHARWTHAAVYIGSHRVVEALVAAGVTTNFLFGYVGGYLLRARRDPTLTIEERYQIAIQALVRLGERYSRAQLPGLWLDSRRGFWRSRQTPVPKAAVICSQVYADSYSSVTRRLLVQGLNAQAPVKPADLSSTDTLQDVQLCWRSIA